MVEWAAQFGVTPKVSLAGTRTTLAGIRNPDAEVSGQQELKAISNIVAAIGDRPGLGLELAENYPLTAYGVWGFALISSQTLREAMYVGLRFMRLTYTFCTFELRDHHDELTLVVDARSVPTAVRRFVLERDAAAIPVLHREIFGAAPQPTRLTFTHSPPGPAVTLYEEMFGAVPEFDAAETVISFAPEQLDVKLPQASAHSARLAEQQCRILLDKREARTGRAGQVRDLVLSNPAQPPTLDQIAEHLSTSTRTLRRQLASEGTSLRRLLDEVRQHLAMELLNSGMSVEQVSNRLGYTDVSNFSHAFRRWNGQGPRSYLARRTSTHRII
nr:AraC family transcriptional regulator [Antrihabitans stalactiti]